MESSCVFCKIIAKQIPATIIKETADIFVIRDISPKAPTHFLIMPKKHVISVAHLTDQDQALASKILLMARDLATEKSIPSFNLIANNGASAGQSVFHLHFHFLAGSDIYDGGLRL